MPTKVKDLPRRAQKAFFAKVEDGEVEGMSPEGEGGEGGVAGEISRLSSIGSPSEARIKRIALKKDDLGKLPPEVRDIVVGVSEIRETRKKVGDKPFPKSVGEAVYKTGQTRHEGFEVYWGGNEVSLTERKEGWSRTQSYEPVISDESYYDDQLKRTVEKKRVHSYTKREKEWTKEKTETIDDMGNTYVVEEDVRHSVGKWEEDYEWPSDKPRGPKPKEGQRWEDESEVEARVDTFLAEKRSEFEKYKAPPPPPAPKVPSPEAARAALSEFGSSLRSDWSTLVEDRPTVFKKGRGGFRPGSGRPRKTPR